MSLQMCHISNDFTHGAQLPDEKLTPSPGMSGKGVAQRLQASPPASRPGKWEVHKLLNAPSGCFRREKTWYIVNNLTQMMINNAKNMCTIACRVQTD